MKKPSLLSVAAKTHGTDGKRGGQVSGGAKKSGQVSGPRGQERGQDGGQNGDDLWPLLAEFALSMRGWWISTCYGLDLTPAQGMALRSLDPDAPLAMSALADALACDASNVTGVVDKMEARGLIARQGAENDRRVKVLVVTEKGREVRRELLARAAKAPPEIAAMPKQTRSLLAAGLRAFLARASN